jgi:uncharacterized protein
MVAIPIYIAAVAIAEALGVFLGAVPSAASHAVLILVLLGHSILMDRAPSRHILLVLALAPLLRLLSLTIPIKEVPQIYWYAMIGTPVLVAVAATARHLDLPWSRLGLHRAPWPPQILIACSGLPLSLAAFLILQPKPLAPQPGWYGIVIGSIILLIFAGFTEEILFRGLLQQVITEIFGRAGLVYSSTLFAIMYIGSLSLRYVLFIGLLGLFFSWCVSRTGSIWGVVLAHSFINIGMAFLWPFLGAQLNLSPQIVATIQLGSWLLIVIGIIIFVLTLLQSGSTSSKASTPQPVPTQQSQFNELRVYLSRLQVQYQALHERLQQWREGRSGYFTYRLNIIFVLCIAAVLTGLSIGLVLNPQGSAGFAGSSIEPATALASASVVTSAPALAVPSHVAVALPSLSPQPLPTPALIPTTAPSKTAVASTTGPVSAEIILLQIAEAEAALRMGQLEATITYGSGQSSAAQVRFDLGDEQRVPRFQITTSYTSTDGVQSTERITIGDQAWERQQDGQWTVLSARESALKQLQVFLPRTDSISDSTNVTVEGMYVLRWYDAARDADVTLRVDTAGIPQQLRRVSRANGLVLTVTYSGWNSEVDIAPPD